MTDPRDAAARWLARGVPATVIDVTQARGSVPRGVGTRMLVGADDCVGTLGGGHLEWKAIEQARALLAGATDVPAVAHYPLGPALGQCCGGAVTLRFAPLDAATLAAWPVEPAWFHLQLHGAGHVGRAIVRALAPLRVRVDWIDARDDEFAAAADLLARPMAASVARCCTDGADGEVASAPPGACFLVLTHRHDLDLAITEAVLRRADFAWLGLIGSRTKRQRFAHRLAERGIEPALIERITCPIGVAGIEGQQPEVIAAAVVAQLLQVAGPRR
ncbi:MAG: xanthine dehydrogenase accessory protein XdhC [Burkholderiaceae bacterium]